MEIELKDAIMMQWDDPNWIEPVAFAALEVLERHRGHSINTQLLISEMGFGGLRNAKLAKALGKKLALLRASGEELAHAWHHSATRFAPFRHRETGERIPAIDWQLPPDLTLQERLEAIAKDKETD